MRDMWLAFILFFIGQSAIWFQTNGQFISSWVSKNPLIMSLFGIPIAYVFIKATYYSQIHFENLWSCRMIGFALGILTFSLLTWMFTGEGLSFKTLLTLCLAFAILGIQIFL